MGEVIKLSKGTLGDIDFIKDLIPICTPNAEMYAHLLQLILYFK